MREKIQSPYIFFFENFNRILLHTYISTAHSHSCSYKQIFTFLALLFDYLLSCIYLLYSINFSTKCLDRCSCLTIKLSENWIGASVIFSVRSVSFCFIPFHVQFPWVQNIKQRLRETKCEENERERNRDLIQQHENGIIDTYIPNALKQMIKNGEKARSSSVEYI